MENNGNHGETRKTRLICFYCGTIYDADRGRCPLCGSTATAGTSEEKPAPVEPAVRTRPGKGKFEGGRKKAPKGLLVAAVIFLFLAVAVVTFFIGDMIGWWPGPEDNVERVYENTVAEGEVKCSLLAVEPELIEFSAPGETQELTVRVNADCDEVTYCNSTDASVATISLSAETSEGAQTKSASFTVTAVGSGEAMLTFTCGDQKAMCRVTCPEPETEATEAPPAFLPELNLSGTLVLTDEDDQAIVRVTNLPEGTVAEFSSTNEEVITVDENGYVSVVEEGEAAVVVKAGGASVELAVRVDYSDECPYLNKTYFDLDLEKYFVLELRDEDGDEIEDVRYEIEDTSICEFNEDGDRIYGIAEGLTQVIVTYRGDVYVCIVEVV